MREATLLKQIVLRLNKEPDVRLWRNQVGVGYVGTAVSDGFGAVRLTNARQVRMGLCPGSADLIGIGPGGRLLALEVKTPGTRTRLTSHQQRFVLIVREMGGIAGVVTSVEEAMGLVRQARL